MRLRVLTAAVLAVLASTCLTACRSNVGVAAVVDGHRITESQVNGYITPNAQAVQVSNSTGTGTTPLAPRSYVLQDIISEKLYGKILKLMKLTPDEQTVQAAIARVIGSDTPAHFVATHGLVGYKASFAELALRVSVLADRIRTAVNSGTSLTPILASLKFPVTINPRYGAWDAKSYQMSGDPTAGLPSVLLPTSTPASGSSSATP